MPAKRKSTPIWRREPIRQPLAQHFDKDVKVFSNKHVVMSADKKVLYSVVSPKYNLLSHSVLVDTVQAAVNKVLGYEVDVQIQDSHYGARVCASFSERSKEQVVDDDDLIFKFTLLNSYDLAWPLTLSLTYDRLICSNGAVAPVAGASLSGKHFARLGAAEDFEPMIETLLLKKEVVLERFTEWTKIKFSDAKAEFFFEQARGEYPKKMEKYVMDHLSYPTTLWSFYNALTQYATHATKSLTSQVYISNQISEDMVQLAHRLEN